MKTNVTAILLLLCISAIFNVVFAFEAPVQEAKHLPVTPEKLTLLDYDQIPAWAFHAPMEELIFTYYDYLPGGYRTMPLQVQDNGGVYMVMQAQTANQSRTVYYTYRSNEGEFSGIAQIPVSNAGQGFASSDMDFELENPFFVWHVDEDNDGTHEIMLSYDNWSLLNSPGFASSEMLVWDNGDWSGTDFTPPVAGDNFVWPFCFVSEAPTYDTDQKRRVYVFARNNSEHVGGSRTNILYAYADFEYNASGWYDFDPWVYNTIPLLDDWSQGVPESIYFYKSIAVQQDGTIAMMGFTGINDYDSPDLLVIMNDNYGEGNWTHTYVNSRQWVDDPIYFGDDYFFGDTVAEDSLHFRFMGQAGIMNIEFDALGRVHFAAPMSLCDTQDSEGIYTFYIVQQFMKEICFDPVLDEFSIIDLDPKGEFPDLHNMLSIRIAT